MIAEDLGLGGREVADVFGERPRGIDLGEHRLQVAHPAVEVEEAEKERRCWLGLNGVMASPKQKAPGRVPGAQPTIRFSHPKVWPFR